MIRLPAVEVWVRDPVRGLAGKPDRVEERDGRLRVVDLKSGSRQGEPSEQQQFQLPVLRRTVRDRAPATPRRLGDR